MIYPALGWLGPEVLISNEPRDSTINYIQRSAIRQQTGHCKKKKKGPSILLTFPQFYWYLRIAQLTYWWTQTNLGKWWVLVVPTWDVRGGEGISWSCSDWEMEGQGFGKGIVIWFGQMWRKVRRELCILSALVDLICFFYVHLTAATPEPLTSVTPPSWGG